MIRNVENINLMWYNRVMDDEGQMVKSTAAANGIISVSCLCLPSLVVWNYYRQRRFLEEESFVTVATSFIQDRCPSSCPTKIIKALKETVRVCHSEGPSFMVVAENSS